MTRDELLALCDEAEEKSVTTCKDCGGAGFWWAKGNGPSYVRSYNGSHKVACETCGGNFDEPGKGVIEADEDSLVSRLTAALRDALDRLDAVPGMVEAGWEFTIDAVPPRHVCLYYFDKHTEGACLTETITDQRDLPRALCVLFLRAKEGRA